jgi:hypothetical protein
MRKLVAHITVDGHANSEVIKYKISSPFFMRI